MSVGRTDIGVFLKTLIINNSEILKTSSELIQTSSELISTSSELISTSLELIRTIAEQIVDNSPSRGPNKGVLMEKQTEYFNIVLLIR